MAVVALKSAALTAADNKTLSLGLGAGPRRHYVDQATLEVTNGDSIGSVYRFGRVKSSDYIVTVVKLSDAIASATADIGVYQTPENGGAVVDADFFGSAVALTAADTTGTNVAHESGAYDISEIEMPLWQALGLTADPKREYDIAATLTAAATGSGTLSLRTNVTRGN